MKNEYQTDINEFILRCLSSNQALNIFEIFEMDKTTGLSLYYYYDQAAELRQRGFITSNLNDDSGKLSITTAGRKFYREIGSHLDEKYKNSPLANLPRSGLKRSDSNIFFSYARVDNVAIELSKKLLEQNHKLWMDASSITAGSIWDAEVQKGLEQCPIFLVVLTPNSILSKNVDLEISYALDHEKHIIPVIGQSCEVPYRLRKHQNVNLTLNYNEALLLINKSITEFISI